MIVSRKFKRIKVRVRTPIAKTGNGTIAGGKTNNFLLLGSDSENGKEGKQYLVKGIRGLVNHAMMAIAKQKEVEVCHSSEKETTQKGEKIVPEGFHPKSSCYPENECILHRIMGSIYKPSILKFEPVIIVSSLAKTISDVAHQVHIATEKQNALMQGVKKSIQDFGERYFAGKFTITIELLQELTKEELGFLLKAILYMPELGLGRSINNGSGRLILQEIVLQEVIRTRRISKKGKVIEEEQEKNLWKQLEGALEAW